MRTVRLGLLLLAAALLGATAASCTNDTNGADLGMSDLSPAPDLARPGDGSSAGDLASAADLSIPPPADLAVIPDLAQRSDGGGGGQGPGASINCGNVNCAPPKGACCRGQAFGAGSCVGPGDACGLLRWWCDNNADCKSPGDVCCVTVTGSECTSPAACAMAMGRIGCQGGADCANGEMCCGVGPSPNYYCSAGPCPISRRKYKQDIHYLDDGERRAVSEALLRYRLSTWRYRQDATGGGEHLGFIIDDVGAGPSVAAGGETVDLYGYTSMAVAAIQEQARQIDELRRELRSLRKELAGRQREGSRAHRSR